MIRVLFLDIDDTVLDFVGYVKETMKTGFREFGLPEYEPWMYDRFTEINGALWRELEKGIITFEDIHRNRWAKVFEGLGIDGDGPAFEDYFRRKLHDSGLLMPGAKETLEKLSRSYLLFAASNGPDGQQRNRLKVAGIYDLFEEVFTSGALGSPKPGREFFDGCIERVDRCLEETGQPKIRREEILMIGDSLTSDIGGAVAYGLKSCLLDASGEKFGKLEGVDYEVRSWQEIEEILLD